MARSHRRQHIVPKSYLRAFADPTRPSEAPRIWIISRDGASVRLGTPENTLVENELYTIRLPSGERELIVEHTLAEIEGEYAGVFREKLSQRLGLTVDERATLAVFAAAMLSRPRSMRRHHHAQVDDLQDLVTAMETQHGIPAGTSAASQEVAGMRPVLHADVIAVTLDMGARYIFQMRHTFLVAPDGARFITSDAPCSLFNPRLQETFYGPGLGQPDVELFLPLSPELGFMATYQMDEGYLPVTADTVHELNRRTCAYADRELIASSQEVNPLWFVDDPRPATQP